MNQPVTARDLGYAGGWYAATAAPPDAPAPKPKRHRARGRQLTEAEWAEYQAGWNEALDAYDLDNC
jgi:hypothetical protein